ncbi:24-hydroxycholesterol 7-alpha-hydroxylase isoform X6 [Phalacrocorax carbo]|uniref:24-hydroxycholesterol 7-alpha-hydroxylase isoform X6 n=1 Tax=Phalacrocorax carbo TaxID=9209 RepID=UPI0031197647
MKEGYQPPCEGLEQEQTLVQLCSGSFRRQIAEGHVSPAPAPGMAAARVPPAELRGPCAVTQGTPAQQAPGKCSLSPTLPSARKPTVQHGPVFTIFALGKRFTFVTEEEGTEAFFKSKDLNFEQAVQRAVENAVSVPAEAFYQNHGNLYSMMKGKMGPSNLHMFTGTLCKELHEHMAHLGTEGTGDLNDLVRHVMYPAVVNTLFGKGIFPTSQSEIKEFEEHFQKYDEDFEYASQMPECFLRNWSKSKKWLLKLFEKVVSDAERTNPSEATSKTLLQHLLDNLQGKHLAPNYGLLMLWASQANALPIAFWTLVFILSYPSIYKKIMEDLASVFGKAGKEKIEVSEEDLKKLPFIKWCTLEAIRLRSPGAITKKVVNPIRIQVFLMQKRATARSSFKHAIYPPWLHHLHLSSVRTFCWWKRSTKEGLFGELSP